MGLGGRHCPEQPAEPGRALPCEEEGKVEAVGAVKSCSEMVGGLVLCSSALMGAERGRDSETQHRWVQNTGAHLSLQGEGQEDWPELVYQQLQPSSFLSRPAS